jgi:uncharacterized protein
VALASVMIACILFAQPFLLAQLPQAAESTRSRSIVRAAEFGSHQEVLTLLRAGANPNQRGFRGTTALMMAAKRGLSETVQTLLAAGAKVNVRDELGRTPLMFAASSGDLATLTLFLRARAAVNETDRNRDTGLMAAASAGNPELVRELLRAGAKVDARDQLGRTALLTGARGEDGIKESEFGRPWAETPDQLIHRNIVVRLLLDAGADIHVHDVNGETALFTLDEDAVRELILHRADVNARNNDGVSPLIKTTSDVIAQMLLDARADKNATDSRGRTPLMHAAADGDLAKVRVLLRASADVKMKDATGATALSAAESGLSQAKQGLKVEAYRQIIELLQNALLRAAGNTGSVP